MMNVLEHERGKYEQVWALPDYAAHSPGEKYADLFMQISGAKSGETVIDLGCGAGAGGKALAERGLKVGFVDFVRVEGVPSPFFQQPLWRPLPARNPRWDYGYCCDVMEHIPPEFSMLAVHNMLEGCGAVFFSISFTKDYFGRFVGEPLHMNVQLFTWWRDRLATLGDVVEARDLLGEGIFYVRRRNSN